MKLRKGDKLTFVGFERDGQKNITKIVFETSQKNRLEVIADGEEYQEHHLTLRIVDDKKLDEEMEING